jgi:hypothetical protein
MKRNMFGEEQPEKFEDLIDIRDEYGLNPRSASVIIMDGSTDNAKDSNFYGWCAEINTEVEQETDDGAEWESKTFSTCAWPSKEELLADLKAAGFTNISED